MTNQGKNILITGVSRPSGIGATLAKRFAQNGDNVVIHGFSDYDLSLNYFDATKDATKNLQKDLEKTGGKVFALKPSDLSDAKTSIELIGKATQKVGTLDGLIINHAYSTSASIGDWDAEHIDNHLITNVRASMLLIQEFARQVDIEKGGTITLFTSGQYLGPMISEIAYAVSKDAIIGLCKQCSVALANQNITVNTINPGPNDTGYLTGEDYKKVAQMFPSKRWGTPNDAADLVEFLHSEKARWITGQVIASEGGFNRFVK